MAGQTGIARDVLGRCGHLLHRGGCHLGFFTLRVDALTRTLGDLHQTVGGVVQLPDALANPADQPT
ncbi:hypothetical protein D3C86_2075330 [compost metagenome]